MKKIMSLFIALTLFLLVGCTREDEVKTFRVMFDSDGGSSVKTQVVEDGKNANKPTRSINRHFIMIGYPSTIYTK